MTKMQSKRKNLKNNQLISFGITVVLIVVINIIGSFIFTRFDLTSEKRYTLSDTTKEILKDLDDYVYFKVYLEGDFPAGFKKLRRETKEMLDEFRAYSKFIDYEFINPSANSDAAERNETYRILYQSGLNPTELSVQSNDGSKQMVIWPGALVSYRNDTEIAIDLLESQLGQTSAQSLNSSMQNLEFRLIDAVKKVTRLDKPNIAFIEGHGELTEKDVYDITQTLSQNYNVQRLAIDGKVDALVRRGEPDANGEVKVRTNYDAIVIAKPTQPFEEKDKFLIDQYIMHGGKVLWLVEPIMATMDSLSNQESTIGTDLDLNLDDMLFKYGVRINKNLLLDLNCAPIPIRSGQVAGQAQLEFFRWFYFPLLQAASNHPMVRNMNVIKADFVSSIDATTSNDGINQIPLLKTSDYTKISGSPVFISLAMLKQTPDKRMFPSKSQNVAYLLKGTFPSLYANRMTSEITDNKEMGFLAESVPTSMIVVADGDIIKNQLKIPQGNPLPLGYDQFTENTYGNKEFIMNAISYLVDGEGLIEIRSRELKVRLMDATKIKPNSASRIKWQLINTVLPSLIIIVLGTTLAIIRKQRFSKKRTTAKKSK
jgi:gliding-associated putative ABC transporter substrate-binding component GldG